MNSDIFFYSISHSFKKGDKLQPTEVMSLPLTGSERGFMRCLSLNEDDRNLSVSKQGLGDTGGKQAGIGL